MIEGLVHPDVSLPSIHCRTLRVGTAMGMARLKIAHKIRISRNADSPVPPDANGCIDLSKVTKMINADQSAGPALFLRGDRKGNRSRRDR